MIVVRTFLGWPPSPAALHKRCLPEGMPMIVTEAPLHMQLGGYLLPPWGCTVWDDRIWGENPIIEQGSAPCKVGPS